MTTDDPPANCCTSPAAHNRAQRSSDHRRAGGTDTDHAADAAALDELGNRTTTPEASAVTSAAFQQLLDHDRPVTTNAIATATGFDHPAIAEVLELSAGRIELDHEGSIVGIAGLTINPTPHQLVIENKTRWTWCALDAVGILAALRATGAIHSTDPATGLRIEVPFTNGTPDQDATLFILGGYQSSNVRRDWCPLVNFFATRADAKTWVTDRGLHGDIVSVAQITEEAAAMWRPVTNPEIAGLADPPPPADGELAGAG